MVSVSEVSESVFVETCLCSNKLDGVSGKRN